MGGLDGVLMMAAGGRGRFFGVAGGRGWQSVPGGLAEKRPGNQQHMVGQK